MKPITGLGTALALSLATACASAPVPVAQVASSKAAVRAAEELGARSSPDAALYLSYAEDAFTRAQNLISRDENHDAALELDRAKADAELSLALTKQRVEERRAEEAMARIRDLKAKGAPAPAEQDGKTTEERQ